MGTGSMKIIRRAYTLIEVALVMAILVAIASFVIPNFMRDMEAERLPGSARQLRSLLTLVRANAAFDGLRYRVRFPREDEEDPLGGTRQPIIEREDEPLIEPEVYNVVTTPWAVGNTLQKGVWCSEVRLGRPTIDKLLEREDRSELDELFQDEFEDFDPLKPPVIVEPDGTSEWAVFVLTDAEEGTPVEELDDFEDTDAFRLIEVIMDGETGLTYLQRPFYEEELDLFEEKNWPVVLRQDYLNPRELTENDVLELRDFPPAQALRGSQEEGGVGEG